MQAFKSLFENLKKGEKKKLPESILNDKRVFKNYSKEEVDQYLSEKNIGEICLKIEEEINEFKGHLILSYKGNSGHIENIAICPESVAKYFNDDIDEIERVFRQFFFSQAFSNMNFANYVDQTKKRELPQVPNQNGFVKENDFDDIFINYLNERLEEYKLEPEVKKIYYNAITTVVKERRNFIQEANVTLDKNMIYFLVNTIFDHMDVFLKRQEKNLHILFIHDAIVNWKEIAETPEHRGFQRHLSSDSNVQNQKKNTNELQYLFSQLPENYRVTIFQKLDELGLGVSNQNLSKEELEKKFPQMHIN